MAKNIAGRLIKAIAAFFAAFWPTYMDKRLKEYKEQRFVRSYSPGLHEHYDELK